MISDTVTRPHNRLRLVDTAGIRRRAAVAASKDGAESLSVDRSFKAIRRSDVAVLVLDALDGVTQQDFRYVVMEWITRMAAIRVGILLRR